MSYHGVVNIIRSVSEAINPDGFFQHGRTWDASLNFDEGNPQIYLYPLQNSIDEANHYYETWSVVMGFFIQDAQDSTAAEREEIIKNADILQRQFTTALNQIEGIELSGIRTEPKYRQMAGTYSGVLLNFTLGATTNICGSEAEIVIIEPETLCDKIDTCLNIDRENGSENSFLTNKGTFVEIDDETSWGEITGTLTNQTDLTNALNTKEDTANKASGMSGNTTSNTVYLTAKAIYDWAVGAFQTIITAVGWGSFINSLNPKTSPDDADQVVLMDSADSNISKKLSWNNLKTTLLSYVTSQMVNSKTHVYHFDDCVGILSQTQGSTLTINDSHIHFVKAAGSSFNRPAVSGRPGVYQWSSNSNNLQTNLLRSLITVANDAALIQATCEWGLRVDDLGEATKRYVLRVGWTGDNGGDPSTGAYFRYTDNVNSGKWECVNRLNDAETSSDSGISVIAGNWTALKIVVSSTETKFYINDTLAQTITSNVPSSINTGISFNTLTSGFVVKRYSLDYWFIDILLNSSR